MSTFSAFHFFSEMSTRLCQGSGRAQKSRFCPPCILSEWRSSYSRKMPLVISWPRCATTSSSRLTWKPDEEAEPAPGAVHRRGGSPNRGGTQSGSREAAANESSPGHLQSLIPSSPVFPPCPVKENSM